MQSDKFADRSTDSIARRSKKKQNRCALLTSRAIDIRRLAVNSFDYAEARDRRRGIVRRRFASRIYRQTCTFAVSRRYSTGYQWTNGSSGFPVFMHRVYTRFPRTDIANVTTPVAIFRTDRRSICLRRERPQRISLTIHFAAVYASVIFLYAIIATLQPRYIYDRLIDYLLDP